jgi:hypothetical protein
MPYPPNDAGGYDGAFTGQQADWLKSAAAVDASYTFYLQHQPQDDSGGEEGKCIGAGPLYDYMKAANPNVTGYFYGHVHFYKHLKKDPKGNDVANEAIVGNGGATANVCVGDAGTADCRTEDGGQQLCGCSMAIGYAVVTQLPDGNIDVSVYQAEGKGNDPLIDRWKVTPSGKPAN